MRASGSPRRLGTQGNPITGDSTANALPDKAWKQAFAGHPALRNCLDLRRPLRRDRLAAANPVADQRRRATERLSNRALTTFRHPSLELTHRQIVPPVFSQINTAGSGCDDLRLSALLPVDVRHV